MTSYKSNKKLEKIWNALLKSVIQEFCFDIHRAVKLEYLFLDPDLDPDFDPTRLIGEGNEKEKTVNNFTCPECKKYSSELGFKKHLLSCMGYGRKASNVARERLKRKQPEKYQNEPSVSTEPKRAYQRKSPKASKPRKTPGRKPKAKEPKKTPGRKPKAKEPKKTAGRKPIAKANSSKIVLQINPYRNMTYEERKAFFEKKCGSVINSFKKCSNSVKCSHHSAAEKEYARQTYLSNLENVTSDNQLDVIQEDSSEYLYT